MRAGGKLTTRTVETAKAGMHSDGGGLYLLVSPAGGRRWAFVYRRAAKRTELGLGTFPDVTLANARDKAAAYRQLLLADVDPLEAKRAVKQEAAPNPKFGDVADQYITEIEPQFRNPKHTAQWRMTLTDYCGPIRSKTIDKIETTEVMAVLKPIWLKVPETAYRLRGRIERVIDFAKVKGWRSGENPARWRGHLDKLLPKRPKLVRGHHAAMRFEDVPAFMAELRDRKATAAVALEFAILTAARSGEVLGAGWPEIDFDKAVWTVPAVRMKAGREHRVPLSAPALAVLKPLHEARRGEAIFCGYDPDKPLSGMAMTMMLRRMKHEDITVHGFRSAFRDWTAECTDVSNEVCEAALAHVINNKAEAAYRRGDLFEKRRKLMDEWGAYCEGRQPVPHS
ncbi:MAG: integrase arm-type DNA-binding domain-containing protein [Burkholderiales bacterium]|nr:integrase arm-type DNA-binding domain-containing protein [Burkholderiales bacterium]